jgi:phage shock protein PspC (stress-responsive transcriptional regulator)
MTAVNIETIKEIINKVGNPTDIDDSTHTDADNAFTSETKNDDGQEKENFFSSFGDETSAFGKIKKNINTRRFYRNADNKMLGGICSGMAEYFGIGDVIIWRLGVLILAIICGINISLSFIPDFISISFIFNQLICYI